MADLDRLYALAESVRSNAYAPYSNFAVGAALLCANGRTFTGTNVENGSFGLSICAERSAVFAAVGAGERDFAGLAVAGPPAETTLPCGACRQVMAEFNPRLPIVYSDRTGRAEIQLDALLPQPFTAERLKAP